MKKLAIIIFFFPCLAFAGSRIESNPASVATASGSSLPLPGEATNYIQNKWGGLSTQSSSSFNVNGGTFSRIDNGDIFSIMPQYKFFSCFISSTARVVDLINPNFIFDDGILSWDWTGNLNTEGNISAGMLGSFGTVVANNHFETMGFGSADFSVSTNCCRQMMNDGTITGWTLLSTTTGTVKVDLQKTTFSNYPAGWSSIVASSTPTFTSVQKSSDSTLSGWTTTVDSGDIFRVILSSHITSDNYNFQVKVKRR